MKFVREFLGNTEDEVEAMRSNHLPENAPVFAAYLAHGAKDAPPIQVHLFKTVSPYMTNEQSFATYTRNEDNELVTDYIAGEEVQTETKTKRRSKAQR